MKIYLEDNNIISLINERGMTKRGLCSQAGLTRGALHKIINGQDVRLSTASKIAEALGCRVSDLWDV